VSSIRPLTVPFQSLQCVTSGFRRGVDQICALLRYYAAYRGNSLWTFRDNLSVPSSRVRKSKKKNTTICCGISQKSADLKPLQIHNWRPSSHLMLMKSNSILQPFATCGLHSTRKFATLIACAGYINREIRSFLRMKWETTQQLYTVIHFTGVT
jgi:hypothetical protein